MSANSVKAGQLIVELQGEQAMVDYGSKISAAIAETAQPIIIFLSGDLGAGKTTFVGFLASFWDYEAVSSPTFTLIHQYPTRVPLVHMDLYRLDSEMALMSVDLDRHLENSDSVVIIEWPSRLGTFKPDAYLTISLEIVSDTERQVSFSAEGERYQALCEVLKQKC